MSTVLGAFGSLTVSTVLEAFGSLAVLADLSFQCQVRGGRLGDEVTSQTQAIQSIADKIAKTVGFQMLPK